MGDARRKADVREGKRPPSCTCPLVSVTEVPPIDPKCPVHGVSALKPAAAAAAEAAGVIEPKPPAAAESASTIVLTSVGPNHWKDEMPDPNAFRCPHCGAWRPGYGFNGQHATMPGMGLVDYVTMYCGECRVIIQVQILALDPAGAARGFRTH